MTTPETRIAILETNFSNMTEKINSIDHKIDVILSKFDEVEMKYARKASVDKLRAIVRGIIGFVFLALGGAIVNLVVLQH